MQLLKTQALKPGMKVGRPVYEQSGELLLSQNEKLKQEDIERMQALQLPGVFILEPTESVQELTKEELSLVRFQAMMAGQVQEELEGIVQQKKATKLDSLVEALNKHFGHLDKPVRFFQPVRSKEDDVYRHALNVAILCTMLGNALNMRIDERLDMVAAALVHDIGLAQLELLAGERINKEDPLVIFQARQAGLNLLEESFTSTPALRRLSYQCHYVFDKLKQEKEYEPVKLAEGAKVLVVAELFDTMTGVVMGGKASSQVAALRYMLERPQVFESRIVEALLSTVSILTPGDGVMLNTGEKALVVSVNQKQVFRPVVLCLAENKMVDLANERAAKEIEIVDVL